MRRYPLVASLVALVVSVFVATGPAQGKRPITLDDLARFRSVSDPQVSPDGKWVAYTVGTMDAEKDKRDTDLWMVSWDGSQQIRLTATPDTSESMPRWSPDGRSLAFLTSRGDEEEKKKGRRSGCSTGWAAKPRSSPTSKGGVSDFAWSPDSKRLVLSSATRTPTTSRRKWKDGSARRAADRYRSLPLQAGSRGLPRTASRPSVDLRRGIAQSGSPHLGPF